MQLKAKLYRLGFSKWWKATRLFQSMLEGFQTQKFHHTLKKLGERKILLILLRSPLEDINLNFSVHANVWKWAIQRTSPKTPQFSQFVSPAIYQHIYVLFDRLRRKLDITHLTGIVDLCLETQEIKAMFHGKISMQGIIFTGCQQRFCGCGSFDGTRPLTD